MQSSRVALSEFVERRLIADAGECAAAIALRCGGQVVRKRHRLDPPGDFDRAVVRLADDLRECAEDQERAAVASALRVLDVDWMATTPAQRSRLKAEALRMVRGALAELPKRLRPALITALDRVVIATRIGLKEAHALEIGREFSALDTYAMRVMVNSHIMLAKANYGMRLERFDTVLRDVLVDGFGKGLSRKALAKKLHAIASQAIQTSDKPYWEIVAGAFVARGRACAQIGAYEEAGVKRYRIHAVRDERTSAVCRFMDGREFATAEGIGHIEAIERAKDTEQLKSAAPWLIERQGVILAVSGGSRRIVGNADQTSGKADLAGLALPPYHGLCRTTTILV